MPEDPFIDREPPHWSEIVSALKVLREDQYEAIASADQIRESAWKQGWEAGHEQWQAALDALNAKWSAAIDAVRAKAEEILIHDEGALARKMAHAVAEAVLAETLASDATERKFHDLVKRLIDEDAPHACHAIHVHPDRIPLLKKSRAEDENRWPVAARAAVIRALEPKLGGEWDLQLEYDFRMARAPLRVLVESGVRALVPPRTPERT